MVWSKEAFVRHVYVKSIDVSMALNAPILTIVPRTIYTILQV